MKKFLRDKCKLFDAHCHIHEIEKKNRRADSIDFYISSISSPQEYEYYKIQKNNVFLTAGVHPNIIKNEGFSLDEIYNFAHKKQIIAIGEIGLDKRYQQLPNQIQILKEQLQIAKECDLPVIFHVVKEYYTLLKIIKSNFPEVRGYIHGFHQSKEIVKEFSKYNLLFSIGAIHPKPEVIINLINERKILLESDAPYNTLNSCKIVEDNYSKFQNLGISYQTIYDSLSRIIKTNSSLI